MRIVGIDPGASGAIVLLNALTGELQIEDMPTDEIKVGRRTRNRIIPAAIGAILRHMQPTYAIIELVGAMPEQGVASTFAFGHAAGVVEGAVAALGISYDRVRPQDWQKAARVAGGKTGSRLRAAQLFPAKADQFARVKDDGRADAACMAYAGLLMRGGL